MNEKKFFWLMHLHNCNYYQKKGGSLSDFERFLGFKKQNKNTRDFLKELIDYGALEFKEYKLNKNNFQSFPIYIINKKRTWDIINEQKQFFYNILEMMDDHYFLPLIKGSDWGNYIKKVLNNLEDREN